MVMEITADNYEKEVLESDVPVLLDFWATWCMTCKMIAPSIQKTSDDFEGKIKVGKIDIDKQKELAQKFKIMNIPTLVLIKDGKKVFSSVGVKSKKQIEGMVENAILV